MQTTKRVVHRANEWRKADRERTVELARIAAALERIADNARDSDRH